MSRDLRKIDPDEQANEVVIRLLRGMQATDIAKDTGIPRAQVLQFIENFNTIAHNMPELKNRAKEAMAGMDMHYSLLIRRAYEELDKIELTNNSSANMFGQKTAILKLIAGLEDTRMKALQQAGLIDDMGDEVTELMEKNDILEGIIRDVSAQCPNCKLEVMRRLGKYTGNVEVVNA